ncbi:MAG: DUF2911 domain-containing protein [Cyclobacteriaceae bacterium]|jgi:hypothetical protein|nr:DUF2911 domain-containing protein [Cyclobacteriaceae bacterium]
MKKFLLTLGLVLVIILSALMYFRMVYTKKPSPAGIAKFESGKTRILIEYYRPFKKGRVIFGELVPYGKVWRTGANEATLFETNKDLAFGNQTLKAGEYSVFTIPGEKVWSVIFNSETGQWGIGFNGEANRNPSKDKLTVEAIPSNLQEKVIEQFTIALEKSGEDMELIFMWDKTLVSVPFTVK